MQRFCFQRVAERLRNGEILGYRITYLSPPNINTTFVGPECTWAQLELLGAERSYHVFVDARTSAGYNEQRLHGMISVVAATQR